MFAFDGDPTTAWRVGALDDVIGERIVLTLDDPTTIDNVTLQQATGNRSITRVRLRVGERTLDVDLGPESFTAPGQTVTFPATEADKVSVEVLATNPDNLASYEAYSGVGFAEISVPGVRVTETLRMPTDLLSRGRHRRPLHPLYLMVTRNRTEPGGRSEPERSMRRTVELPSARSYTTIGDVRLDAAITDCAARHTGGRDRRGCGHRLLVRFPATSPTAAEAPSTATRAPGGRHASVTPPARGCSSPAPHPRHPTSSPSPSPPTDATRCRRRCRCRPTGSPSPPSRSPTQPTGPSARPARSPSRSRPGRRRRSWRLTVDAVHERITTPWLGNEDYALPVAIADVDGLDATPAPFRDTVDTGCRSDLVSVDGTPVPVRVTGSVADALARRPLSLARMRRPRRAGRGHHHRHHRRRPHRPGRRPSASWPAWREARPSPRAPPARWTRSWPTSSPSCPRRNRRSPSPTSSPIASSSRSPGSTRRTGSSSGQSFSEGWTATSAELGDLGAPTLIQGFANGWALDPTPGTVHVTVEWGPQKVVWAGIGVSLIGVPLCLLILIVPWIRRRRRGRGDGSTGPDARRRRRGIPLDDRPRIRAPRSSCPRSVSPGPRLDARRHGGGCLPSPSARWSRCSPP